MLEKILSAHAARYPKMEPTDAVKLIYQNEFGPGHLIASRKNAMAWLIKEYKSLSSAEMPLFEEIGSGLVRVNLCKLEGSRLEWLLDSFCRSAEEVKGDVKNFEKKLYILRKLTAEKVFSFGSDDLEDYLAKYKEAGYPPVSHSQAYRDSYNPSYRVILRRYIDEKL